MQRTGRRVLSAAEIPSRHRHRPALHPVDAFCGELYRLRKASAAGVRARRFEPGLSAAEIHRFVPAHRRLLAAYFLPENGDLCQQYAGDL
jgi:hypothetical protein